MSKFNAFMKANKVVKENVRRVATTSIVDENGKSHISVEDYAVAMVDEMEQEKHHRERFTIGY